MVATCGNEMYRVEIRVLQNQKAGSCAELCGGHEQVEYLGSTLSAHATCGSLVESGDVSQNIRRHVSWVLMQ